MGSRSKSIEVDFDRMLSVLFDWLGGEVVLSAEVSHPPFQLVSLGGALTPAAKMAGPNEGDEFGFTLGDGFFTLRRDGCAGACFYPEAEHLEISIEQRAGSAVSASVTLHVLSRTP